ncbi:MAG: DEAD/DEAH box helicase, partial [Candidatus Aenigmarchaeota archaeon]|nr:DEAD/DEAH box helicase [Candidatus Aenigmarchaeota archaeon]
ERYEPLGYRVAISVGDLDATDAWLSSYDIIITSTEKLDSLMRHGSPWIMDVGLLVADEIHLLDSPERGPTLEMVLTKIRKLSSPRILALSATISNHKEIAGWLDAEPVKSDYRPVKLFTGVVYDRKANFLPRREFAVPGSGSVDDIILDTALRGKQALAFINTRRGAESAAEKLAAAMAKNLPRDDAGKLLDVSEKLRHALEHPTKQCHRLADCVRGGAAFHHAGLASKQRKMIEDEFRAGTIKAICSTPSLALGLNLPAYRVIIRDLKRFSSFRGTDFLPVLEIQQMCGRAGRPKYDTEGEAILLPKSEAEARYAWENYVKGEPEKIYSKLGVEPVLRMHVLALVASGICATRQQLMDFFFMTFYAHQYKDLSGLEGIIGKVLAQLADFGFIESGGSAGTQSGSKKKSDNPFVRASEIGGKRVAQETLKPTLIGRRVSELYIDPLTADHIITHLNKHSQKELMFFPLLHLLCNAVEMKPLAGVKKGESEDMESLLAAEERSLMMDTPNSYSWEYEEFLRSVKTAMIFNDWAEEKGEDIIMERRGVSPGELHARLERMDWMLYSAQELALLLGLKDFLTPIRKARIRVKNGVKEELLPLIRLKGVGRVRARRLWASNIRSMDSMRKAPKEALERILGEGIAMQVMEQLGSSNLEEKEGQGTLE